MSRRQLPAVLVATFCLLLLLMIAVGIHLTPFQHVSWTINRKTGERHFYSVDKWVFWKKDLVNPPEHHDLTRFGELRAPDRTMLAFQSISLRYPWSGYDEEHEEEIEPGWTIWWAHHHLFAWLDGPAMTRHYPKEELDELRKKRLELWNSPRLDTDPQAILEEVKAENRRLLDAIP